MGMARLRHTGIAGPQLRQTCWQPARPALRQSQLPRLRCSCCERRHTSMRDCFDSAPPTGSPSAALGHGRSGRTSAAHSAAQAAGVVPGPALAFA